MKMVMVVRFNIVFFFFVQVTVMFIQIMRVLVAMGDSFMDMEMPVSFPVKTQDT
jgi:hypothetical protein